MYLKYKLKNINLQYIFLIFMGNCENINLHITLSKYILLRLLK